jgi:hypothetical protein
LQVRRIDLAHADLDVPHLMHAIAAEPASDRGDVVKLHAGRRYKQALLTLD